MASLNNNIALLYQEMNDFPMAVQHLKKALSIIEKIEGMDIEVATTYTNLAASLIEINQVSQAEDYLKKALEIFAVLFIKTFCQLYTCKFFLFFFYFAKNLCQIFFCNIISTATSHICFYLRQRLMGRGSVKCSLKQYLSLIHI